MKISKLPFRRKLFFIPGYDPFPPRRYRELYRSESAAQGAISGYLVQMQPAATRQKDAQTPYRWRAQGVMDGAICDLDAEVLIWSDIVKSSMPNGILATYGQMLQTLWIYAASGAFFRQIRLRRGPALAAIYPVLVLALQAVVAGLIGGAVGWGFSHLHPALAAVGLLAAYGVLRAAKAYDHRIFAHYLMHDFAFSARHWGDYPPALSDRMAQFTAKIRAALDEDYDEVLIVGHSSGAYMGVTVLADLLRAGVPDTRPEISLLTLGQVVPMVSFLPRAWRLRADLHDCSQRADITWVDVTAPGDACAFALCDPVAVTGVAPAQQRWPLILSCAFSNTLAPDTWAKLRYRFFRLHCQYLYAFDRAGHYDYFRITAGAKTLAQRYAGMAPSPQRITRALSHYRTMTP